MAKTRWTEAMVETLLRTLYEQVVQGEWAENGFKKKGLDSSKGEPQGGPRNWSGSKSTKNQVVKCMLAKYSQCIVMQK